MDKRFKSAALIAADWGTSRLRVSLLDECGNVLDQRHGESGVGSLKPAEFEQRFEATCEGWPKVPAILAGMIGSRQGWKEAGYRPCPTDLSQLSANLTAVADDKRSIYIVPGMSVRDADGNSDVMRGEETQISGLLSEEPRYTGIVVLPGTHSKWVQIDNGRIEHFKTFLTGELFAILSKQSILSHTVAQSNSEKTVTLEGFKQGVTKILLENRPLLGELFNVRARGLIDNISDEENRAYLSAMIIASEIAAARDSGWNLGNNTISLIGAPALLSLYEAAFALIGVDVKTVAGSDAVLTGIMGIAREAGLIAHKDAAQ